MLSIKEIRRRSIKAKLVIDFGTILIGICVFSYFFVSYIYQNILNQKEQDKIQVVTNAANAQMELVIKNSLMVLSNVEDFNVLSCEKLSVEDKAKRLEGYASPFNHIGIVDTNGEGITINNHILDMSGQADFREVLGEKKSSVNILRHQGEVYLVFLKPILNELDDVSYVLMGVRHIEPILEQILKTSSSAVCFIANEEGQLIIDVAEKGNINSMHVTDEFVNELFKVDLLPNEEYIKSINNKSTKEPLEIRYSLIQNTDWILGTINSKAQVYIDILAFKKAMIIGMSLMIGLGLVLVYISANAMTKRMRGMINYLEHNIKNEFKDSIPNELLENEDEIGILAKELKHLESEMQETLETIRESMDYINNLNEKMKHNNKK